MDLTLTDEELAGIISTVGEWLFFAPTTGAIHRSNLFQLEIKGISAEGKVGEVIVLLRIADRLIDAPIGLASVAGGTVQFPSQMSDGEIIFTGVDWTDTYSLAFPDLVKFEQAIRRVRL